MSIELAKKYSGAVAEQYAAESKLSLLTNQDYDWSGGKSVVIWKVATAAMSDYSRRRGADFDESEASLSRFGKIVDLDAATQEMLLRRDRSFIFNIDRLDEDETAGALQGATALARQVREVAIPEADSYCYAEMVANAGTVADAAALTPETIYDEIIKANETLDDFEIPDVERVLLINPAGYRMLKKSPDVVLNCDIGEELRLKGVVATLDGLTIVKVPSARLPENFGFMVAHPSATCAPVKLEDFGLHSDTALSSGTIVTGRIVYDCFVLDNRKKGIYYFPVA